MPIKRLGMPDEKPARTIKRVSRADSGEYATKETLLDHLVVVTLKDYDPAHPGNFGSTQRASVDVIDLDTGEAHEGLWLWGNLAKQIAAGLGLDETGAGRVVTGPTKGGNAWWGFAFTEDEAELDRADEALAASDLPY